LLVHSDVVWRLRRRSQKVLVGFSFVDSRGSSKGGLLVERIGQHGVGLVEDIPWLVASGLGVLVEGAHCEGGSDESEDEDGGTGTGEGDSLELSGVDVGHGNSELGGHGASGRSVVQETVNWDWLSVFSDWALSGISVVIGGDGEGVRGVNGLWCENESGEDGVDAQQFSTERNGVGGGGDDVGAPDGGVGGPVDEGEAGAVVGGELDGDIDVSVGDVFIGNHEGRREFLTVDEGDGDVVGVVVDVNDRGVVEGDHVEGDVEGGRRGWR